jgi:hypothetical protein
VELGVKKEYIMTSKNSSRPLTVEEQAFLNANSQRLAAAAAIKAGTFTCLPGTNGYVDTAPAVNVVDGTNYSGANLLLLKEHQRQNNFPTAEYVSQEQVDRIKQDRPLVAVKHGEQGVVIFFQSQKSEGSSGGGGMEWENKYTRLFNIAQTNQPWEIKAWAKENQQMVEFMPKALDVKQKTSGAEIVCSSTEAVKYLGQFFAAVEMGRPFKVSPEQEKAFAQNMEGALFAKTERGKINPLNLSKISNEANLYCKDFMLKTRTEERKLEREQKIGQSQGRGR